jgi:hypothetical protein
VSKLDHIQASGHLAVYRLAKVEVGSFGKKIRLAVIAEEVLESN